MVIDKYVNRTYTGVISDDGTHIKPVLISNAPKIYVGDDAVITVTLPSDATGVVSISVGGKNYAIILKDGVGTLPVPNLAYGTYNVTVNYNGDNKYTVLFQTKLYLI